MLEFISFNYVIYQIMYVHMYVFTYIRMYEWSLINVSMRTSYIIKNINISVAKHVFLVHVNSMWVLEILKQISPMYQAQFSRMLQPYGTSISNQSFVFPVEGRAWRMFQDLLSALGPEFMLTTHRYSSAAGPSFSPTHCIQDCKRRRTWNNDKDL